MTNWKIIIAVGFCVVGIGLGVGLGVGLNSDNDDVLDTTTAGESTTVFPTTTTEYVMQDYVVSSTNGDLRGFAWDPSLPHAQDFIPADMDPKVLPNEQYESIIFKGVPYAKPPVGDLRWRSPQPMDDWSDIRNATKVGASCSPNDWAPTWSEDCLYLNIFVPKRAFEENRKVPVSVWFHGGAFAAGAGSIILYDGRHFAHETDMILVTVNYRLGALGFLMWNNIEKHLGETHNGNWGLLDQTVALEWIQQNIEAFSGDKDKVMIFGQSAGGISVAQHLIYPRSQILFHTAAIHSNPFAIACKESWEAGVQANWFGRDIDCPTLDMECMRGKTKEQVLAAQQSNPITPNNEKLLYAAMKFSPVVDGIMITEQPFNSLKAGRYDTSKDIIVGVTEHETEIYVRTLFQNPVNDIVMLLGMGAVFFGDDTDTDKIINGAIELYNTLDIPFPACNSTIGVSQIQNAQLLFPKIFDGTGDDLKGLLTNENFQSPQCETFIQETICSTLDGALLINACNNLASSICAGVSICDPAVDGDERNTLEVVSSDLIFVCPMRQWADVDPVKQGNIWVYQFRDIMPANVEQLTGKNYARCFNEVSCHAADLSYMFEVERRINCSSEYLALDDPPVFHTCPPVDASGKKMERTMRRYWANLARNGNPNDNSKNNYPAGIYENDGDLLEWEPFSANKGWFVFQSGEGRPMGNEHGFKSEVCEFWDEMDAYLKI